MRSKTALALVMVVGMAVFFTVNAFAANAWYNCTIVRIGGSSTSANSPMYVMLTDSKGDFTNKNFRIPEGRLNQIMAVLLTAASTGSKVRIYGDHTIAKDSDRLLRAAYYIP